MKKMICLVPFLIISVHQLFAQWNGTATTSNVGIGVTTVPTNYKLHVANGEVRFDAVKNTSDFTYNGTYEFNGDLFRIGLVNGGNDKSMSFETNARLTLNDNNLKAMIFLGPWAVNGGNIYGLGFKNNSTTASHNLGIYTFTSSYISLGTTGNERMRITPGGNIGIGTSTPGYLLSFGANTASNQIALYENNTTTPATTATIGYNPSTDIFNISKNGSALLSI